MTAPARPRRRLVADLRPLRRYPDYRRLWIGSLVSALGGQMTTFAVALQVFRLTGSSAAVGAVGLCFAVPAISVGLAGGVLIDTVDRRRLVLVTSAVQALVSVAFAGQAFGGSRALWLLYALTAVQGGVGAVNAPARRTFAPRLVPREQLPAAAALTMIAMYVSMLAGPALAGVLAAAGGLKLCYLVDALSFAAALYSVFRLPQMRPENEPDGAATRRSVSAMLAGLRFVVQRRALRGALLADLNATVLAFPVALFPALNAERFGGSPRTLGLLSSALAVGGLLGSVLSGPVGRVARPGRGMLTMTCVWGTAVIGLGLSHALWLSLAVLACAGAADTLTVVFRTSIVQLATPDPMRGRVSSVEFVVGAAFPQLGNFRAGAIASATSSGVSAVSGGLASLAGVVVLATTLPAFVNYRPGEAVTTPA